MSLFVKYFIELTQVIAKTLHFMKNAIQERFYQFLVRLIKARIALISTCFEIELDTLGYKQLLCWWGYCFVKNDYFAIQKTLSCYKRLYLVKSDWLQYKSFFFVYSIFYFVQLVKSFTTSQLPRILLKQITVNMQVLPRLMIIRCWCWCSWIEKKNILIVFEVLSDAKCMHL